MALLKCKTVNGLRVLRIYFCDGYYKNMIDKKEV